MFVNKKVLAAAIVGALMAGNAAAADLSASPVIPAYFAKEIIATPAAPATLGTSLAGAQLQWDIGYNFSQTEVRYVRVECSDNIEFDAATVVTLSDPAAGNVGSINGLGTNVMTFSITSTGGPANNVVETDVLTVSGDHDITGTDSNVNCDVALYDQPSQAQAGGSVGRIANTHFSGAYLAFAPSYRLVATASEHTADVEASPSFSQFVVDANTGLLNANVGAGTLTYGLRDPDGAGAQTAVFGIDGNLITMGDILDATSTITVAGDYTLASNAAAPLYTGAALTRVVLAGNNANALTASSARFNVGATPFAAASLALTKPAAPASRLIPVSDYVATLNAVSADPTTYAVTNIAGVKFGSIVRNGTELQAPLVNVPGGWISRLVLTNTGSVDRPYAIAVQGEDGNTITTNNLTGTVKAGKTMVIDDLNTVLTGFSGRTRATLNVTVAGPTRQIQGLYQIVNPESGSISNHVMVRPGTN